MIDSPETIDSIADGHISTGVKLFGRGKIKKAIICFEKAMALDPQNVDAHYHMGMALRRLGKSKKAVASFRKALEINPNFFQGWFQLGLLLTKTDSMDHAISCLLTAVEICPDDVEACTELAIVLIAQGDIDAAITYFDKALAIRPNHPVARWNRSVAHLLSGNFNKGWKDFDWRQRLPGQQIPAFKDAENNRWDGGSFADKRLLIYSEQGLGDTLQFVRYLPTVKALGGTVILGTYKPLLPLLKNFDGIDHLVELPANSCLSLSYDLYLPIMSLPVVFHTTPETIPSQIPYLVADPLKIAAWRHRFSNQSFKVGIVWKDSPDPANDRQRSCQLEQFLPLMKIPDIQWYGLQKGAGAEEVDQLESQFMIDNLGEEPGDFCDTAAVLENVDLLISVDTAVVHLAGAMGKNVWTLLPFAPDWRWQLDREDSPWYPTMRLYRQPASGDWGPVFEKVAADLRRLVKKSI
jgi:tetratricopeptide (TPR) repeat protein